MYQVSIVNSFVVSGTGGNPAGVLFLPKNGMSSKKMQSIAKKMALSETAFVSKSDDTQTYSVRFFTPTEEVPLCGHATLAVFHLLSEQRADVTCAYQDTAAGLLTIKGTRDALGLKLIMSQPSPKNRSLSLMDQKTLKKIMGIEDSHPTSENLPIEIWSTGLEDILLPVKNRDLLNSLTIDFKALASFSSLVNVVGVHAFAIEGTQIYARNFAPLYGIDEESATGTSNGALIAYLHHHIFPDLDCLEKQILQGELMGNLSAITAISERKLSSWAIWVGGYCKTINTVLVSD